MGDRPALTFAIALTPARTPAMWRFRRVMLSVTLRSIYQQTDGAFRIVLAGDRPPDLECPVDDRLAFLPVASKSTTTLLESHDDVANKLRVIAVQFAGAGGGCLMPLDMDDLVSNRLVAFVRAHPDDNGYLLESGYGLDATSNTVAPVFHPGGEFGPLHKVCGSSAILNLAPEDVVGSGTTRYSRLRREGHYMVAEEAVLEGRSLMSVPFRAVLYVLNHGANLSNAWPGKVMARRQRGFLDAINRLGHPSATLAAEFAVPSRYPCADDYEPPPRGAARWLASLERGLAALTGRAPRPR